MTAIYLDANAFIYLIEGRSELSDTLRPLFALLQRTPGLGATSEVSLAEVLAPRAGVPTNDTSREAYLRLLRPDGFLRIEPVTRAILVGTVEVRRVTATKLVDAIHLSTAIQAGCSFFVSQDGDFRRMPPGIEWGPIRAADIARVTSGLP